MAAPTVIQGTWEEISARADELKGRSGLVLVVPVAGDNEQTESVSAADGLAEFVGILDNLPEDLSVETGKRFTEALIARGASK